MILKTAAEGFEHRGVPASRAVIGAVPVAVLFVLIHELSSTLRAIDLALVGAISGLLYLQTGELALGIGTHFGALYGGTVLFALLGVTGSLSGMLGTIDQYGFPKMVIAYLCLVVWMTWRQGDFSIHSEIARRTID